VVTADDVGLHPGMTLGALKAHDEGIVTACSVVANGRAFADAVERLRDRPRLDVGIHLTLVGERPLSPPETVRSLIGSEGAFLPGFRAFTRRYLLGGIDAAELETELRRQIERLLAAGLEIIHANSHQHLHVLPKVFDVVLRLAEEYRIPWVRIPREPRIGRPSPRSLEIAILNGIGRRARRQLQGSSARATGRTVGIREAGRLNPARLSHILEHVDGFTELICHPGLGGAALSAAYDWGYGWDDETAALCAPEIREALRERNVELTTFTDLP
jgi:chitin disaccharide deacetylase